MAPLPISPSWMNSFGYKSDGTDTWFPDGYTWGAIKKGLVTIGKKLGQSVLPVAYVDPAIDKGNVYVADPFGGKLWVNPSKPTSVVRRDFSEVLLVEETSYQPGIFYGLEHFWLILGIIIWVLIIAAIFRRPKRG